MCYGPRYWHTTKKKKKLACEFRVFRSWISCFSLYSCSLERSRPILFSFFLLPVICFFGRPFVFPNPTVFNRQLLWSKFPFALLSLSDNTYMSHRIHTNWGTRTFGAHSSANENQRYKSKLWQTGFAVDKPVVACTYTRSTSHKINRRGTYELYNDCVHCLRACSIISLPRRGGVRCNLEQVTSLRNCRQWNIVRECGLEWSELWKENSVVDHRTSSATGVTVDRRD